MERGGKRPGAGHPKGKAATFKRGDLPARFGDKIADYLGECLESDDKALKKWAVDIMMPYVYRKQPSATEVSGPNGKPVDIRAAWVEALGDVRSDALPVPTQVADESRKG